MTSRAARRHYAVQQDNGPIIPMRKKKNSKSFAVMACLLLPWLSSCAGSSRIGTEPDAAQQFLTALNAHCGKAYAGRIVANEPASDDDPFADKALIMHVRDCGSDEMRVPFHVGDDHSRTWVLSRLATGLQLKHDHRHQDGSQDVLTWYGGTSTTPGSAQRQAFPADQESRALFEREKIPVSVDNVWAMEINERTFIYELARPNRLFRVEFDLGQAVALPPPTW